METRRDGGSVSGRDRRGGRNLAMTASAVDWAANGKTGPVKDQGACGSCYTFASNTVLEATLSIEQGIEYRRLSEQQIVDCATWDKTSFYWLYGCNGGYMNEVWWYQKNNGAMLDADYPYTANEGNCVQDSSKFQSNIDIDWWEYLNSTDDNQKLIDWVMEGPVAIAVSASPDTFMFYESGIVTNSQCNGGLDHAVVLVGYEPGTVASSSKRGGPLKTNRLKDTVTETECRRRRWRDHFYESGCQYSDETLQNSDFCCWEVTMVIDEDDDVVPPNPDDGDDGTTPDDGDDGTTPDDGDDGTTPDDGGDSTTPDYTGPAYFKVQNSWGTAWGDDGFIYMAVESGNGPCNMNIWADRVLLN